MVMKSAEDRHRCDAAYVLDGAMDRSIFAKRPMSQGRVPQAERDQDPGPVGGLADIASVLSGEHARGVTWEISELTIVLCARYHI
jgi:hypothetical protein